MPDQEPLETSSSSLHNAPDDAYLDSDSDFDIDAAHLPPGEPSSLNSAQSTFLGVSLTLFTSIIAIPTYLLTTLLGLVILVALVAPGESFDVEYFLGSAIFGVLLAIAIWVITAVWNTAKRGLVGAVRTALFPPLGRYLMAGLLLFLAMRGISTAEQAAPIPLLRGLFFGYAAFLPIIALPLAGNLSLKFGKWLHRLGSRSPFRAGALAMGALSFTLFWGTIFFGLYLERDAPSGEWQNLIAALDSESSEHLADDSSEPQAQYMGIFSGNGWTEKNEIIARRRDECFEGLATESEHLLAHRRWSSFRHLHTREDAEDAIWLTILKVCEAHGEEPKEDFRTYFHRSLSNTLIDFNKANRRSGSLCHLDIELERSHGIRPPRPDEFTRHRQDLARVQRAFCTLTPNQQKALQYTSLGYKAPEIARELNTTPANVRQLVTRGRQKLQQELH